MSQTRIFGAGYFRIRKSFLVSFVPFISSRIHTGSMPLPDHFRPLSRFDRYFGSALRRLPFFGPRITALVRRVLSLLSRSPSVASRKFDQDALSA
jgi:hypothetical protein